MVSINKNENNKHFSKGKKTETNEYIGTKCLKFTSLLNMGIMDELFSPPFCYINYRNEECALG